MGDTKKYIIPNKTKLISQAPLLYLVSLNLIICVSRSSTNYRRHHFNYFRLFFSFHSLVYFFSTSFFHSYKIKLNGTLLLPTLRFLCLSPWSIVLLMWTTFPWNTLLSTPKTNHFLLTIEPSMKPLCHFILIHILFLSLFRKHHLTWLICKLYSILASN